MSPVASPWAERILLDPAVDPSRCGPVRAELRNVLLTGATGFLGAYLLDRLLAKEGLRVYCLVRGDSVPSAKERLAGTLRKFKVRVDVEDPRVVVIPGDLAKPELGLSPETQAELATDIDAIAHCGANVAFAQQYAQLEGPNVGGTVELLRLATRHHLKVFDHISTIGVVNGARPKTETVREDDDIDTRITSLKSGYAQSKWVAEKVVAEAFRRGVPGRIFRPAYLSGSSVTGVSSLDDNRLALIRLSIESHFAPALDVVLDMMPVDVAAAAIVEVRGTTPPDGRVFHVANFNTVPWSTVVEWMNGFGHSVELVPRPEWTKKVSRPELMAGADKKKMFLPFQADIEIGWLSTKAPVDCSRLVVALEGTGVTIPKVDNTLWQTYVRFLVGEGFLPAPAPSAGT